MSFRLSFIATNALLVARLSEIPFAIFPIVVPLAGQTMYASNRADPDADLAARLLLFSVYSMFYGRFCVSLFSKKLCSSDKALFFQTAKSLY